MNRTEFAQLVNVSRQAVDAAIKHGRRLHRSLIRDERGRVVGIEPGLGVTEWEKNANPARVLGARVNRKRRATTVETTPSLLFSGLDAIEKPGTAFVHVVFPLDAFVRGAAVALREKGKEPTPDALRAVIASQGGEWWWMTAIGALESALDQEIPVADLPRMWELGGREAVLGEPKGKGGRS